MSATLSESMLPEELEADATVPQCLDNQYVSHEVFVKMAGRVSGDARNGGLDIASQKVQQARDELLRSLVYSAQIVVNRAYFVNSPQLYSNYLPGDREGIKSFAKLLCHQDSKSPQAIVPYLHKGGTLGDVLPFSEDKVGRSAINALLDEAGEVVPVVLDRDPDQNDIEAIALEMKFGEYLSGHLKKLTEQGNEVLLNEMAGEVFGSRYEVLQQSGLWESFRQQVENVATYAYHKSGVTRTNVYENFLVCGNTDEELHNSVIEGNFKVATHDERASEDFFTFEIKKLIDLVYNTNLPDRLGRYTFTPFGMPSRLALRDFQRVGRARTNDDLIQESGQLKQSMNQIFMANAHQAMALPLPGDLSITDVVQIRNLDAWNDFSAAQQKILQNPLQILDLIEDFTQTFNRFQHELSRWYFRKYKLRRRSEQYATFATVALQIGGSLLAALGFPGQDVASILTRVAPGVVIPRLVNRPTVKLMVYVVDLANRVVDAKRSYSIDLMQTQNDYTRDDVLPLLDRFNATEGQILYDDREATQLSDQGK
ncbi:hypothetical protein [Streptomyces sp. NBC_00151]|uniref:hypothetical protein n=1 Tax=Streptomyces sp. NBC_00151 TaxID=2975669 RepID=UPI002DD8A0E9|nr:hypothetical protein [Streptomyces sp. NBC_00151]WRZ40687.1 hypothetical protein OG915_23115 [Streptomyces sp. NBC_00151]